MNNNEYLLNLGNCYCVIIPNQEKAFVIAHDNPDVTDLQNFLNNKEITYEKYVHVEIPFDNTNTWTNYLKPDDSIKLNAQDDLGKDEFLNRMTLKKHTDGLLTAIRDLSKNKVKIYDKNLHAESFA